VGLPPADKNQTNWPLMRPRLSRPELRPAPADIRNSLAHFQEMLRIRRSSRLFCLRTADQVMERLRFHNTGPNQVPGIIVMSLSDVGLLEGMDPMHDWILVAFNATIEEQEFALAFPAGIPLELHPVLAKSHDTTARMATYNTQSGEFRIPARTTAVFVAAEGTVSQPLHPEGHITVFGGRRLASAR
jgi:hypothetical protein